jgi:hypothetical protein
VKFLYSDTQDYIDPGYDFINDRNAPGRKRYWDDRYAHEIMDTAPYDGLLVSMSAVKQTIGGVASGGRYTAAEAQRFLRDGARKFLRFGGSQFGDKMLMGDCGAFAYADQEMPAFSPEEVFEFYADAGFTHGCAPDHIIFEFDPDNRPVSEVTPAIRARYAITLENAREFLALTERESRPYEPLGAVQGWSPQSMAEAAATLEKMGYRYLAIGGLVPLRPAAIHQCLKAIRQKIRPETRIHLLGFAKAEQIDEFVQYDISSFDSTSPLIRAFKDARANYYLESPKGGLEYFAAIRVPQAMENPRLMQATKRGVLNAEETQRLEALALNNLRAYHKGTVALEEAMGHLMAYQRLLAVASSDREEIQVKELAKAEVTMRETLDARPWQRCKCAICRNIGVEVIIFRSSNRNKRRGMHNLGVYYQHLKRTLG